MATIDTMGLAKVFVDGTDLGPTLGGVHLKDDPEVNDVLEDGKGVVEQFYGDENITLEFEMTRTPTDILAGLLPNATVDANQNILRGSASGTMVPKKEIVLKPLENGKPTTDVTKHWKFFSCGLISSLDLKFTQKDQKPYKIKIRVYYSEDNDGYYQLGLATA